MRGMEPISAAIRIRSASSTSGIPSGILTPSACLLPEALLQD
jgi:hypothetical protein